eukprot:Filipodium_phascolosomae@DN605_c0_g1_i1.p1
MVNTPMIWTLFQVAALLAAFGTFETAEGLTVRSYKHYNHPRAETAASDPGKSAEKEPGAETAASDQAGFAEKEKPGWEGMQERLSETEQKLVTERTARALGHGDKTKELLAKFMEEWDAITVKVYEVGVNLQARENALKKFPSMTLRQQGTTMGNILEPEKVFGDEDLLDDAEQLLVARTSEMARLLQEARGELNYLKNELSDLQDTTDNYHSYYVLARREQNSTKGESNAK